MISEAEKVYNYIVNDVSVDVLERCIIYILIEKSCFFPSALILSWRGYLLDRLWPCSDSSTHNGITHKVCVCVYHDHHGYKVLQYTTIA